VRKVFVYLLVVLLPLHFGWAAASGYHVHDTAVDHVGHLHDHDHDAGKAGTGSGGANHTDCSLCHVCCAVLAPAPALAPADARLTGEFPDPRGSPSWISDGLERPDWLRLA
jgi:hypothetical protein